MSTTNPKPTPIRDALREYEARHEFARSLIMPEEDRAKFMPRTQSGAYRWWRADNIVDLSKVRRLRQAGRV